MMVKPDGKKYRILLTDDAHFMINQYKRLLEKEGFKIAGVAKDGLEAVNLYRATKPDAVIMDITMPHMGGIDAIKAIIDFDKEAKILVSSAIGKEATVKEAIRAGARHYVIKPIKDDQFLKALKQVIDR